MFSEELSERVDSLIDELIMDGGIEAASLASIILAARDSIRRDDFVRLSKKVWMANDELLDEFAKVESLKALSSAPLSAATPRRRSLTG